MKNLKLAVLMLLGGLLWSACQKGKETTMANPIPNDPLTVEVNLWLDRGKEHTQRPEALQRFEDMRRHLHMDKAWRERVDSSLDLLIIPVDGGYTPTKNAGDRPLHYLLMRMNSNGTVRAGHLVQYIPAGTARDRVPEGTFTSYFTSGIMPDSRVVFMTTTGNFLYETFFTGGKMSKFNVLNNPKAGSNTEEECIDWYLQTWVDGVLVSEVYVFTTCGPYVEEGSGGGNSGGGDLEPERSRDLIWVVVQNPVPGVNGAIASMEVVKGKKVAGFPQGGYFTRIYHHGSSCNFCHTDEPLNVWMETSHQVAAWGQQASASVSGFLQFNGGLFENLGNAKNWRFDEVFD